MLGFIAENAGTILVLLILAAAVAGIVRGLRKKKAGGKCACCGDCSACHGCEAGESPVDQ